jgi:hypothetical protein
MTSFRCAAALRRAALLSAPAILLALLAAPPDATAGTPPGSISGVVTAVDLDGRSMTVKDPRAGEVVVLVPDNAVIVLDGDEQAVLEDVFDGDIIESATLRDLGQGKLALVKAVISTAPEADEDANDEVPPAPEPAQPSPPRRS